MTHNVTKWLSLLLATMVMVTTITVQPLSVQAADPVDIEGESAILVDYETGKILYAKNPDMALPPASMTKIMTEYLVHEAIEEGQISWDTTTEISDYAYSISADASSSGVGLKQDEDYTVKQLYDAMAINSDNATTIALAELVAGSEGEFVKMMNDKAEEMGMTDTEFVNSTGLANASLGENVPEGTDPDANNLMSARSSALLAYHLINDYPGALDVTEIPSAEFEGEPITNWNWMLDHDEEEASSLQQFYYEGVDGLKTGHTDLAKYCFTGTAERDNNRLISVVMKTESMEARFEETAKLLDYGFDEFETQEIFPAGYQLEDEATIPVSKGKEDTVAVATKEAFSTPVKGDQADSYSITYQLDEEKLNGDGELAAPIEKGEKVGTAEIVYDGDGDYGFITPNGGNGSIDLVAQDTVEKNNWFMLTLGAIGSFFGNLFNTVVDTVKGWF
ncbi:D-alanyl-D-alanine carboxypeptidase family protein [Lentibacillus salinarum]|uniref:D-alanyl-D-alanine carboxypeptidase family protein n=1 Tax=Lentibacillus salinarum TaxID=446820 RepID=UPI0036D33E2A